MTAARPGAPPRLEEPTGPVDVGQVVLHLGGQSTGKYQVMSRATDASGRTQSRVPRYNNMRKNFTAIVATTLS